MMLHSAGDLGLVCVIKQRLMFVDEVFGQLVVKKRGEAWECQDQSYGNHDPPAQHCGFGQTCLSTE